MSGNWERSCFSEMVSWAMAWMGRCFLIRREGTGERQSRGRYTDDSFLVKCLEAS